MADIRAFVGHSFAASDDELIRKFTTYFSQVAAMTTTGFSWQHAQPAEPVELSKKVLGLLQDKNLFIGICTKKERVVQDHDLKPQFWGRRLCADERSFEWKTSDWITQEIGLAFGMKLDLILFLEQGVRAPGGLQGNLEYIPFERNHPEKSFGKFAEMLSALNPKLRSEAAKSSDEPIEIDHAAAEPATQTIASGVGLNDTKSQMFSAALSRNAARLDEIHREYRLTAESRESETGQEVEAFRMLMGTTFLDENRVLEIDRLAERHPGNGTILSIQGHIHHHYAEYERAADLYLSSSLVSQNPSDKINRLGFSAVSYANAKRIRQAFYAVSLMRPIAGDDIDHKLSILRAIRQVAKIAKMPEVETCGMEYQLALNPGDVETLASLAYLQGQLEQNSLSLLHYLRIPESQRSPSIWNNTGVAFGSASLPGRAVTCYEKAGELGESLALSNLAYIYMDGGLLADAQRLLTRAKGIENYHRNVDHAMAKLRDYPDQEEEKLGSVLEGARVVSDFYRSAGRSLLGDDIASLPSQMYAPEGVVSIALRDGTFVAEAVYEKREISSYGIILNSGSNSITRQFSFELRGTTYGRLVVGRVRRKLLDDGSLATLLDEAGGNDVVLTVSEDTLSIQAMEMPKKGVPTFWEFTSSNKRGLAVIGSK